MKTIYTIRKFVVAKSIKDALKKEKHTPPTEIYFDEFNLKNHNENLAKKLK